MDYVGACYGVLRTGTRYTGNLNNHRISPSGDCLSFLLFPVLFLLKTTYKRNRNFCTTILEKAKRDKQELVQASNNSKTL